MTKPVPKSTTVAPTVKAALSFLTSVESTHRDTAAPAILGADPGPVLR